MNVRIDDINKTVTIYEEVFLCDLVKFMQEHKMTDWKVISAPKEYITLPLPQVQPCIPQIQPIQPCMPMQPSQPLDPYSPWNPYRVFCGTGQSHSKPNEFVSSY